MSEQPRPRESRRGTSLLAALAAFGIGSLCWISGLVTPLDRASLDRQTRWLEQRIDSDVVIVELDARSLHELGAWPWHRSRHAQLIDQLQRLGARRLFIDIDFSAPAPLPEDDAALAGALSRAAGSVVLPAFWQPLASQQDALILSEPPPAMLRNAGLTLGSVDLVPGPDGLVRDVADLTALSGERIPPVWRRLLPETAAAAAPLRLDYRISPDSFDHLSYVDILSGRAHPDLRGKTVFVGATAIELGDIVSVPIHGALPGVVVQAIAYESARARPVTPVGPATMLGALLAWALLCAAWLSRVSWRKVPLLAPVFILAPLGASLGLYALGRLFFPAAFIAVSLSGLSAAMLQYLDLETLRSWRALLRLRHQDALLRQIADASTDGILTLDEHGRLRDLNGAAATMLGGSLAQLRNAPFAALAPALRDDIDALGAEQPLANRTIDLTRADGTSLPVEVVMMRLSWEDSFVVSVSLRDVSARRRREQELHYLATHDGLTQLGNRRLLLETLQGAIAAANDASRLAVLLLDLDGFRQVNYIFGHSTGDDLLVELAKRLQGAALRCPCIARMGGDEFALLLSGESGGSLAQVCEEVRALTRTPVMVQGVPISLEANIGVAEYPTHAAGAALLLQRADIALNAAKKNHESVVVYSAELDSSSPRRLQMVSELRAALGREELSVHFQPKVLLRTGEVVEVEALCRWRSPVFGEVSPAEFMPLIEASELIRPFTEWTLRCSLASCRRWRDEGLALKVAVNLSARHLMDAQLPQWLGALLRETGTEPQWLELEITESALMEDTERALGTLHGIRELGVALSIDDFGTGYSSLAYLQKLAVNRLKIDKAFVAGLGHSEHDRLIVKSTIDLAHGLGLQVVAEGIETPVQYRILQTMGCEYGQGFLIAPAMPDERLRHWYAAQGAVSGTWHSPLRLAAGG